MPLLVLLACAARGPAPAALPIDHPTADARPVAERIRAALLAESNEAATPWRATVVRIGSYQLAPDREVVTPEPEPADFTLPVVSDEGEVVRIVDEIGDIRMVVGVRREHLASRPTARTKLGPDAGEAGKPWPGESVAEVAGGAPVTAGLWAGKGVLVTWEDEGLRLDGWAPTAAFDEVWRAEPYSPGDRWADVKLVNNEPDAAVPVPLHALPDGASPVLGALTPDVSLLLFAAGAPVAGWQRVEALTTQARAVAWVPPGAVVAAEPYGTGRGSGGGTPGYRGTLVELAAGVWLRPLDADAPFAQARRTVKVPLLEDRGTTVRVRLRSRWGDLDADVGCAARSEANGQLRCGPDATP
jgi:hypothetical protein